MVAAGVAGAVAAVLVVFLAGGVVDFARSPILWLIFTGAILYGQLSGKARSSPPLAAAALGFALAGLVVTGIHSLGPVSVVSGQVEQVYTAREWKTQGWRYVLKTEKGTLRVFFRSKPKYLVGDKVAVHIQTLMYTTAENLSDPATP